jgi:hypothetical protein
MSTIKPEAALYKRLKENLPNSHITRLESRVGLGVPDCLIALGPQQAKFVMVELKVVKRGRKVALSPHQIAFHLKHADFKVPTFVLVQYQSAGTASSRNAELRLYRGEQAGDLALVGIDIEPAWACNLAQMQWHMLRLELLK